MSWRCLSFFLHCMKAKKVMRRGNYQTFQWFLRSMTVWLISDSLQVPQWRRRAWSHDYHESHQRDPELLETADWAMQTRPVNQSCERPPWTACFIRLDIFLSEPVALLFNAGHCYANTLLNANRNDTHAILPFVLLFFSLYKLRHRFTTLSVRMIPTPAIKFHVLYKACETLLIWLSSILDLPLPAVLSEHQGPDSSRAPLSWIPRVAMVSGERCHSLSLRWQVLIFFFFFFPTAIFALLRRKLVAPTWEKKKQAAEENMSDDTRGADGSSERHQNKLWSLI